MLIRRAYRFRVYPTEEQTSRLVMWEKTLRWLWNLALEQRKWVLNRPKADHWWRRPSVQEGKPGPLNQPTYIDQQNELPELRKMDPWLDDVPSCVGQGVLRDLDKAWQRWQKRLGGIPRFKGRRDTVGMLTSTPKVDVGTQITRFPKLGDLKTVFHRPVEGEVKTATLTRDVDQWYVSISCEVTVTDPTPRTGPVVAIDRGVVLPFADSDGRTVPNPHFGDKLQGRITRAQRAAANKKPNPGQPGSRQWRRCLHRVAVLKRKEARQRDYWIHQQSRYYADKYGVIVLEDLKVKNMTRSASGTLEKPGTNVAAKSGLNKSILAIAWGKFALQLKYKSEPLGGSVVEVNPAYTSQTCSVCGSVDEKNRKSQSDFLCVACGHQENADVNAAKVSKNRYEKTVCRDTHGDPACGGSPALGGAMKQEFPVAKSGSLVVSLRVLKRPRKTIALLGDK